MKVSRHLLFGKPYKRQSFPFSTFLLFNLFIYDWIVPMTSSSTLLLRFFTRAHTTAWDNQNEGSRYFTGSHLPPELLYWFINSPAILLIFLLSHVCKESLDGSDGDRISIWCRQQLEWRKVRHDWFSKFGGKPSFYSTVIFKDNSGQIQSGTTLIYFRSQHMLEKLSDICVCVWGEGGCCGIYVII